MTSAAETLPELFGEDELVGRLLAAGEEGQQVVFLVGSPLTAPFEPGAPGVPGVAAMIERVRDELGEGIEVPRPAASNPYQDAFTLLQAHRGVDAVNWVVRRAVLEACPGADAALREKARAGDAEACRSLERDEGVWEVGPGLAALGELVARHPDRFDRAVLTTNFDALVEIAVRRAGGSAWTTVLHGEGGLEQSRADGCQVIHAHGYWAGADTLHTPAQLGQERPRLRASLKRLFEHALLVVVAYGGWEDVFTRTLYEVLADGGAFPEVLWTLYGTGAEAREEARARIRGGLAPGVGRGRVVFYEGIDCHRALPRLAGELAEELGGVPQAPEEPPRRSPFVVGMPIERDEEFFGRRAQRDLLLDVLSRPRRQSVQILGERRMGKTSLLRWVQRHAGAVTGWPVAWVSAQGRAGRSPDELVRAAAWSLGRAEEVEDLLAGGRSSAAEDALEELLPLVLLVDEADGLARAGHGFGDGFLKHLRSLGQEGRMMWVSASLDDVYLAFLATGLTSSFLNDARQVRVGLLEDEAAEALAGVSLEEADAIFALDESGGFAYGLQALADALWRGEPTERARHRVERLLQGVFDGWWGRRSPGERSLLRRAAPGDGAEVAGDGPEARLSYELEDLGLLRLQGGRARPAGRLWRRYLIGVHGS